MIGSTASSMTIHTFHMFQVIIVLLERWKISLRFVVDLEQPAAPIRVLFALHGIQCALGQGGPLDRRTANVTREFLLAGHFPINAIVAAGKSQYGIDGCE
jgi:hypothetical protein